MRNQTMKEISHISIYSKENVFVVSPDVLYSFQSFREAMSKNVKRTAFYLIMSSSLLLSLIGLRCKV